MCGWLFPFLSEERRTERAYRCIWKPKDRKRRTTSVGNRIARRSHLLRFRRVVFCFRVPCLNRFLQERSFNLKKDVIVVFRSNGFKFTVKVTRRSRSDTIVISDVGYKIVHLKVEKKILSEFDGLKLSKCRKKIQENCSWISDDDDVVATTGGVSDVFPRTLWGEA